MSTILGSVTFRDANEMKHFRGDVDNRNLVCGVNFGLQTSSFELTPSPSKTPLENPLNMMLNIVKQEVQDSCDSPKVKEEPEEKPAVCMEGHTTEPAEIKTEPEKVESV